MKKLALASVAFAGITAFGAGDSFAAGFVGYTSATGFSSTDTTVWGPVGAQASGAAGSTANFTFISSGKHIAGTAVFGAASSSHVPQLIVLNQSCPPIGPNTTCAGFKPNTHVLGDNEPFNATGSITLFFNGNLSAIGFQLSPVGSDWGATLAVFSGNSVSGYTPLGQTSFTGKPVCFGTANTACTTPQFIGATDTTTPITKVRIGLNGPGVLEIGPLLESAAGSKIPEPASLSLLGAGLLGLGALRRRRRTGDPADRARWSPFGYWRVTAPPPDRPTS